jgi:predicted Ser/Thr protein kinase
MGADHMTQPGPTHDPKPDPRKLLAMARGATRSDGPAAGFVPPSLSRLAELLPDFEVQELIGCGGMGAVYRARQKRLDRVVAIKVLPPEIAKHPAFAERFSREARTLARLSHPNIVRIFDFGEVQGLGYLVLEYVEGTNLRQLMAMGRLSPEDALLLVPAICDALQYAHEHGVVHRDIKPENILIDHDGRVHIADFGIARLLGGEGRDFTLTGTRQRVGTPHYMAPEQVETPDRVDHRADIFALGVVLYEMLTGCLPLGRFGPPSAESQVGPRVDDIVLRSLEREPDRRYQAASAMKDDVEAVWREGFAAGQRGTGSSGGGADEGPPGSDAGGDATPGATEPAAPRLSLLALAAPIWFFLAIPGLIVPFLAVRAEPHDEATADQTWSRILTFAILGLGALGIVGGPALGALAIKRIRRSQGRLYGVRPAVLATCAPLLLLVDGLVLLFWHEAASDAPRWAGAILALVVLYLNYRFLVRQVELARAR